MCAERTNENTPNIQQFIDQNIWGMLEKYQYLESVVRGFLILYENRADLLLSLHWILSRYFADAEFLHCLDLDLNDQKTRRNFWW